MNISKHLLIAAAFCALSQTSAWAQNDFQMSYDALDVEKKAALKARLIKDIKTDKQKTMIKLLKKGGLIFLVSTKNQGPLF